MIIIFGIRRFTIRYYTAAELGLTDPSWNGVRFEVLQQYFHLMFIPFFPVGKMTGTRGADGKLYHLTPQMQAYINAQNLQHKTPWYSFAGLILVAVFLLISSISSVFRSHRYAEAENDAVTEYKTETLDRISNPSTSDYYKMEIDTNGGRRGFIEHQVTAVFRVDSFAEDSIRFRSFSEAPFAFTTELESDKDWWPLFNDTNAHSTFWLKKEELRNALIPSSEKRYTFNGARVELFGKPRYIVIQSTEQINGPQFVATGTSSANGIFKIELTNKADEASEFQIANMRNTGEWTIDADSTVDRGEVLKLVNVGSAQGEFMVKMVCRSTEGHTHGFLISGTYESPDVEVRRIN